MVVFPRDGNAAMLAQDQPDGAGGARQAQPARLEFRVTPEVIQDGFGARRALEMLGWVIADGEDAVDDERIKGGRGMLAGT